MSVVMQYQTGSLNSRKFKSCTDTLFWDSQRDWKGKKRDQGVDAMEGASEARLVVGDKSDKSTSSAEIAAAEYIEGGGELPGGHHDDVVLVVIELNKKLDLAAFNWALNYVVERGNTVRLLGVLDHTLNPMDYKSPVDETGGKRHFRRWIEGYQRVLDQQIAKHVAMLKSNLAIYTAVEKMGAKLDIDVQVSPHPKHLVIEEAKQHNARYVVIDRHIEKDKKFYINNLTCYVTQVKTMTNFEHLGHEVPLLRNFDNEALEIAPTSETFSVQHLQEDLASPLNFLIDEALDHGKLAVHSWNDSVTGIDGIFYYPAPNHDYTMMEEAADHQIRVPMSPSTKLAIANLYNSKPNTTLPPLDWGPAQQQSSPVKQSNSPTEKDLKRVTSVRRSVACMKLGSNTPPPYTIFQHESPEFKNVKRFTYAELQDATNEFSSENHLAKGGFGTVYKGRLKNGQLVAVKQHTLEISQGDEEFCAEVEFLCCAQHRNLVTLIGHCVERQMRLLVFEYVCNGSLDTHFSCEIIKDCFDTLEDKICGIVVKGNDLKDENDSDGILKDAYEIFKNQLYEDIKKIDCIQEVEIDHVDTETLLYGQDVVILSFYDDKEEIFEFYFKNCEHMASIVGVGLEHAVVILESGVVSVKEIMEEAWNQRWKSIERNQGRKMKLFKRKMATPSSALEVVQGLVHLDVEFSSKKPLLWELTKYFSLRESIAAFMTKDMFVKYAFGVESTSSTSPNKEGKQSMLQGTWMWVRGTFTNGELQKNENEGSTSNQYEERVMKDSEDCATIVKMQLLPKGLELKDEWRMKPFLGTIKSNLQLQFMNKGGDGKDGKEVRIIVGNVSFKFGRDDNGNQLPWYHENLRVMFGILNKDARGYGEIKDESFEPLKMRVGMVNMKISSTHGHTKGKESIGKGGISIKPHGVGLSGEYQQKWSLQDTGTELSERSVEVSNDDYTEGGLILKSSIDEFRIVCDYSVPKEVPSLGPPSTRHFIDQDVMFQGIWLPKGDGGSSLHFVEYTLHATRALRYEDKPFQQKYTKTILVNHSMTHLDGKTYRLRERERDSKSILTKIESWSEPEWSEPLVKIKDIPNQVSDATIQNVDQQTTNNSFIHNSPRRNRCFDRLRLTRRDQSTGSANSSGETLTAESPEVNSTSNSTRRGSMRW